MEALAVILGATIPPRTVPVIAVVLILTFWIMRRIFSFREEKRRTNMSDNNVETMDINTSKKIRLTDNSPKECDDFQKVDQYASAMTGDQIKDKLDEILGDQGMA